jgi:hypothetical protein
VSDGDAPHAAIGFGQAVPHVVRGPEVMPRTTRCQGCSAEGAQIYYPWCQACEGRRNRAECDRLAAAIREAKARPPGTPDEERKLLKQLIALGHPFADEFIKALTAPKGTKAARTRREEY